MLEKLKRWLKWISLSVGLLLILFVATVEYTSRPKFCNTCHYMHPYYASWKTSSHHDVPCLKCHYPPGVRNFLQAKIAGFSQLIQYVTHTYGTKPWAEIDDRSCLRSGCHVKQDLLGPLKFKKEIFFSHKNHLKQLRRGKKLRCTSCHSQIVQGEHLTVTPTTCFLCHFKNVPFEKDLNRCTLCHKIQEIPKDLFDHSFVVQNHIDCRRCHGPMVIGTGNVPPQRCYGCHAEKARLAKYGDVDFMHATHITRHKVECIECHLEMEHKTQRVSLVKDLHCTSCHENTHVSQKTMFLGFGGKGVPRTPNMMLRANVHCTACHIIPKEEKGEINRITTGEACNQCHGKGYDKVLVNWKKLLKKGMNRAKKAVTTAKTYLKRYQGRTRAKLQKELLAMEDNIQLVIHAHGVHNIVYSMAMLNQAIQTSNQILKDIGYAISIQPLKEAEELERNPCAICHLPAPTRTLQVFGQSFPHGSHVNRGFPCTRCHTGKENHGKLAITQKDCSVCHGGIPVPHPKTFKKEHPMLAKTKGKACQTCHGKSACENCHGIFMPHPEDFLENHYEVVGEKGMGLCQKCHREGFCETCHGE